MAPTFKWNEFQVLELRDGTAATFLLPNPGANWLAAARYRQLYGGHGNRLGLGQGNLYVGGEILRAQINIIFGETLLACISTDETFMPKHFPQHVHLEKGGLLLDFSRGILSIRSPHLEFRIIGVGRIIEQMYWLQNGLDIVGDLRLIRTPHAEQRVFTALLAKAISEDPSRLLPEEVEDEDFS